MLTRRSGAPRTVHRELAHAALPPLPLALVLAILLLLPVDQRLLLALVSRAWRAATDDRSLWEQVRECGWGCARAWRCTCLQSPY